MSSGSEDEFSSKDFDPLKLLYSKDHKKPKPADVCLFDNLASLEGYFKRTGENLEEKFDKTKKPCQLPKKVPMLQDEVVQRRFEPHQQMIHVGRVEKGRNQRSVVTFMEKAGGPMAQLQKWLADRARVKVLVRKNHGVRGSATGILRLFDRHWNLILTDVEEVYQRKKFRYGNEACAAGTTTEEMALSRLRELGLQHPLRDAIVSSVAKKKKLVEVKRKHPLLFIKGDQVAVVFHDVHDAK